MSSFSPSSSKEFNNSPHIQQSLKPISIFTQSGPPTEPTPEPDLENSLVKDEDGKADEQDQVNPKSSSSLLSLEVSVEPSVNSVSEGMLTSPTYGSRRTQKRKKGKGVGSYKKKQAIEKKLKTLSERLNLVPFIPSKAVDFAKHEMLLKNLGLWDFASIGLGSDFNNIRSDLVTQLIASYDPKSRCSYVNDVRIKVNRADLARAFKLPLKKEKIGNPSASDAGDLDLTTVYSESSMEFLDDFISNWIILNNNEELWIMPEELVNLIKPIKDGHPEKMDWSTLLWFMVEQELVLGDQLVHCNYASHLQHLIRSQREILLSMESEEGVTFQETETVLQERDSDKLILMEEPKIGEMGEEVVLEKKVDGDEEVLEVKHQHEEERAPESKDDGDKEEVLEVKDLDTIDKLPEKNDDGDEEEALEEVNGQDTVENVPKKNGDDEELLERDQDKEEVPMTVDGVKEELLETEDDAKEEVLVTDDGLKEEVPEKKEDCVKEEVLEKKNGGENDTVLEKDQCTDEEVLEMKDDVEEQAQEEGDTKEEDIPEKNDNGDEVIAVGEEENSLNGGPSIELTLGQELVMEEVSKDVEMVDFDEFKYDHAEQDQSQWLMNGKNTISGHFLQRCNAHDKGSSDFIDEKNDMEEDGVEAAEHGFDAVDEFEGEGLDVNFLDTTTAVKPTYTSLGSLNDHPSFDMIDSQNDFRSSGPSYYNNGKRKIHDDDDDVHISHHADDYKRLRTELPEDFGTCMEEIQLLMDRAKTVHKKKVEEQEHSNMNQEILYNELQKRDSVIEHLQQMKQEEIEKRDLQISYLNRELLLMCNLLNDYKKALKQTDKAFDEYRQKNQLIIEEPMYKDADDSGLVLSVSEIEKRKQKDEDGLKLEMEQKVKEAEEGYASQFEEFLNKVNGLDKKLLVFENEFKSLKNSYSKP